jgi:uncharacterized iron-regulated membrane protein
MTQDVSRRRPQKQPFLSPEFVRAMLAGHSALGLAFAALIYVVCLSGTLSVFVNELQRWEQPDAPLVDEIGPEAVAAAVRAGYAQGKADDAVHDMFLVGPLLSPQRFQVNYHDHASGARGTWLADAQGRLVTRLEAPLAEFVAGLHTHLHLPQTWGLYLVGLTGVALLSSLISGLLSHPRIFRDAFALRWGGSRRLQEADLHNRLGVWGLPFHLIVTLTGALLGLSTLIVGVLALAAYNGDSEEAFAAILGPRASADESAAPVPDLAAMIRHVQTTKPDAQFVSAHIDHVGNAGQVVHLGMRTPGHIAFSDTHYFSGDGTPRGSGGLEDGGVGRWILGALSPLHFGWFGGIPVKLLYGVLGLALTVVTHTGVTIWLARRRDKGRPAPGWEKVWAAVGWSQPLALGTLAGATLVIGGEGLIGIYLGTVALGFMVAWFAEDGLAAARALQFFSALALVGVVGLHALVWGGRVTDPMAWYVNLALLASAATLALPLIWSGAVRFRRTARQSSAS